MPTFNNNAAHLLIRVIGPLKANDFLEAGIL